MDRVLSGLLFLLIEREGVHAKAIFQRKLNKFTSVFHASVQSLIMNSVITLSK